MHVNSYNSDRNSLNSVIRFYVSRFYMCGRFRS
ncbi:hypothetical protein CIPAW_15G114800 [Carya illinoinensis]|uniref:Uncharacterized protein n=1 Tax=Carya illinoinensis TaxID=32201 RepID=A0A8T1N6F5_CARIL|nr:hypothetical protein CIPAW_15G114800 [Carya illinoinensis]